jgi:N-acetylglutamate synthase-like GNAT family acetyltransferase
MKPIPEQSMTVRVAQLSDVEQITSLINDAFRIAEGFFIDQDRVDVPEVLNHFKSGAFLVAQDNDSLAGCVYVEPRGDRAYLGLLSVDPARQKTGLGSLLARAAEQHARELGARHMDILIVNLREELPAYYRKLGYIETGTAPFPPDLETKLPCFFVCMAKEL